MDDYGSGGGRSYEEQIAEAAIKADMEHRGYEDVGGGEFKRTYSTGATGHVGVVERVRKGWAKIEMSPNYGDGDHAAEEAELKASMDKAVFDYWPGPSMSCSASGRT